jgi:hypothetical protein
MNTLNRFKAPLLVAVALALPIVTNGCSSVTDAQGAICCTEFKAGATIDASIGGGAQAQVAAQAIADFSGIASAAVLDVTTACRSMAQELDAPAADQDAATAEKDQRKALSLWCSAAVKAIGTVKAQAGGTLTLEGTPQQCVASIGAAANCQASCSGSAKCDLKANPPKCTGGSLSVACKGECTAKAGASLKCTGSCSAECKGSCTAQGGVQCSGKCEGTCKGAAQGGTGTGIKADGTCDGTCEGKCEVTAPGVTCTGSCDGECSGSCTGTAEASVTCDGECKADFEPLKCTGGKLEGGCQVEAKCEGNCDASVSAKAECTPPSVKVSFSGAANIQAAGKLQAVFEANLGVIFAFQARLEGMAKLTGTITGNADVIVDVKASCIPAMIAAAADAVADVKASGDATISIVGATK